MNGQVRTERGLQLFGSDASVELKGMNVQRHASRHVRIQSDVHVSRRTRAIAMNANNPENDAWLRPAPPPLVNAPRPRCFSTIINYSTGICRIRSGLSAQLCALKHVTHDLFSVRGRRLAQDPQQPARVVCIFYNDPNVATSRTGRGIFRFLPKGRERLRH